MTDLQGETAVVASDVVKIFFTLDRQQGFLGGLRTLVVPRRRAKTAVDRMSLTVRYGELVALLGPNGAGKSTTIKLLTGILAPTAGSVRVGGIDPHRHREQNARGIGAVFGQRTQLWWDLPARESLAILRDIFEVDESDYRKRLTEYDDLLELSEFWDTRVRHLSLGQRVRCDLAAALLHDPMIVFLDEPTIGMDVVMKEQVREFLRHQVERRGRAVLLTTHDMTEVDRLAERVVLINQGRLAFDGSLDELRHRYGETWQVHITFAEPQHRPTVEGLTLVRCDGTRAVYGPGPVGRAGPEDNPQDALKRVIERYAITDVAITKSDLEDVMRAAYLRAPSSGGGTPDENRTEAVAG